MKVRGMVMLVYGCYWKFVIVNREILLVVKGFLEMLVWGFLVWG